MRAEGRRRAATADRHPSDRSATGAGEKSCNKSIQRGDGSRRVPLRPAGRRLAGPADRHPPDRSATGAGEKSRNKSMQREDGARRAPVRAEGRRRAATADRRESGHGATGADEKSRNNSMQREAEGVAGPAPSSACVPPPVALRAPIWSALRGPSPRSGRGGVRCAACVTIPCNVGTVRARVRATPGCATSPDGATIQPTLTVISTGMQREDREL